MEPNKPTDPYVDQLLEFVSVLTGIPKHEIKYEVITPGDNITLPKLEPEVTKKKYAEELFDLSARIGPSPTPPSAPAPEFTRLNHTERSRTYVYPDGARTTIVDVTHVAAPKGRSHRLITADRRKHIIAPGWLRIEIDTDEWTF